MSKLSMALIGLSVLRLFTRMCGCAVVSDDGGVRQFSQYGADLSHFAPELTRSLLAQVHSFYSILKSSVIGVRSHMRQDWILARTGVRYYLVREVYFSTDEQTTNAQNIYEGPASIPKVGRHS